MVFMKFSNSASVLKSFMKDIVDFPGVGSILFQVLMAGVVSTNKLQFTRRGRCNDEGKQRSLSMMRL